MTKPPTVTHDGPVTGVGLAGRHIGGLGVALDLDDLDVSALLRAFNNGPNTHALPNISGPHSFVGDVVRDRWKARYCYALGPVTFPAISACWMVDATCGTRG